MDRGLAVEKHWSALNNQHNINTALRESRQYILLRYCDACARLISILQKWQISTEPV